MGTKRSRLTLGRVFVLAGLGVGLLLGALLAVLLRGWRDSITPPPRDWDGIHIATDK